MNPKLIPILLKAWYSFRTLLETYAEITLLDDNTADALMKADLSGMTVTNLVDGADIADDGTVTFASINGDKYYESYTPSVVTGTGSDITITNESGSTMDIHVIHLNSIGLQAITDVPTLTAMFPHYIDGTVHAGATRFTSLGKNLFDKSKATSGFYIVYATGALSPAATYFYSDYIKVSPSTGYMHSHSTQVEAAGCAFYDKNKNFISGATLQYNADRDVVTPANCYYMRSCFNMLYGVTLDTAQIELGSTATTYEPYKKSVTYTPPDIILRRVPSARDTTERNADGTQKKVQRVQAYTLTADDITGWTVTGTNVHWVAIRKTSLADYVHISTVTATVGTIYVPNIPEIRNTTLDSTVNLERMHSTASATHLLYVVEKNKYADLAAARTALAGTVIYYQLATPIETDLPAVPALISKPNGTVIAEPCVCDEELYGTGITVSGYVFSEISKVVKVSTGADVTADCSLTVGADGFTCSSADAGDLLRYELLIDTSTVANPKKIYRLS